LGAAGQLEESQAALSGVLETGRSRLLAAKALVAAGNRAAAVAELERAGEELAICGADRYVAEVTAELGRLGRRPGQPALAALG